MALTPEEQIRLDYINERLAEIEDEKQGRQHVETYKTATQSTAPEEPEQKGWTWIPHSPLRDLFGGIRDAAQGLFSTLDSIDEASDTFFGPSIQFGGKAPNGIVGFGKDDPHKATVTLPDFKGSAEAGPTDQLFRGAVSFAVPFTAALKATSALRALPLIGRSVEMLGAEGAAAREFTTLGKVAQGALAGAATDFAQDDPVGGNMANVLKGTFGLDNAMLDNLASEEDDGELVARLKAAVAGLPIGLAGDAIFEAGAKGLRAYRAWKGTMAENQGIVDAFKAGPVKLTFEDAEGLTPRADRAAVSGLKGKLGIVEIDPSRVTTLDDALVFLREKAGAIETMSEDDLQRFAANLVDGDPENALAKLGIDPAKLDYSAYRDGATLGRLQTGLAEIFEAFANKLGRTGAAVTQKEIVRGAESLASTPEVLRSLYRSTHGLAERIMAARMIAGGHAHKMLDRAAKAMKEIEETGPGEAWADFIETFEEHAYLLGQLRGAGSEVGRALRSLQMLAKVPRKRAAEMIDEAFAKDETTRMAGKEQASTLTLEEGASQYAKLLETDAEKLRALKRLIDLEGDVAELSRTVREGGNTGLRRISAALKEPLVGNLFTLLTATRNMIGSMGYLGVDALGRYAAAGVRSALGLFSEKAAAEAARSRAEAWAITEGVIGGFRPAFAAALGVIKRELLSESSLNLDGLNFGKLAVKAESGSVKAEQQIGPRFERADVVGAKAFAITASEQKRLANAIDELDGPKFFKAGLKGLLRVTSATINAAGTGFRLGTSLTINAPDEFVGIIATHAGAYQAAVRLATKEARLNGLEGKELSQFIKARAITLFGDGPKGWSPDGELAGMKHVMLRAGTEEAKMVLFQDDLEWEFNRRIANLHAGSGAVGTALVPFIKTPLRILERTAIDLNPLGFLVSQRLRKAIVAGGSQRDEALARMALGLVGIVTGYQLAKDRGIVGYDGGYLSSARDAGRPSYSLKIGDDVVAFSGFDPIATFLGFGADLREYEEATQDDPEAAEGADKMISAMLFAASANVLSKTWLTSIKNLADLAGATNGDDWDLRKERFIQSYSNRLIPGAGLQKSAEAMMDPYTREATSFSEGLWKSSIGASELPIKRDFLGRPMENSAASRLFALPASEMPQDPVMREMERLSIDGLRPSRRQKGVKLNAAQFSRFLELRGQLVKDASGLTMEQAMKALITAPEYQALPSEAAKEAAIRSLTKNYSGLAADALTREDESYAQARLKNYIYAQSHLRGWTPDQRDQVLSEQSHALSAWLQHQQQ